MPPSKYQIKASENLDNQYFYLHVLKTSDANHFQRGIIMILLHVVIDISISEDEKIITLQFYIRNHFMKLSLKTDLLNFYIEGINSCHFML